MKAALPTPSPKQSKAEELTTTFQKKKPSTSPSLLLPHKPAHHNLPNPPLTAMKFSTTFFAIATTFAGLASTLPVLPPTGTGTTTTIIPSSSALSPAPQTVAPATIPSYELGLDASDDSIDSSDSDSSDDEAELDKREIGDTCWGQPCN